MSRATPVPDVTISSNVITDSETGVNTATVLIDVAVGDCSRGPLSALTSREISTFSEMP